MRLAKVVVGVLVLAPILGGCDYLPFGYTPVKEITANAAGFEGREIKVKGTVVDVLKIPVLGQAYTLEQDHAQIVVVTAGLLPALKSEVALKGTVRSAVIVSGNAIGTRIEETKRLR
jgi:hypothetical protein